MSQTKIVSDHFNKAYTLTPTEARRNYRIESLSSVISKLNKELKLVGLVITKSMKMDITGKRYAEYCRKAVLSNG